MPFVTSLNSEKFHLPVTLCFLCFSPFFDPSTLHTLTCLLVSEVSVTATVGHNVTLPCWYSVHLNGVRPFCWKRSDCPPTITFTSWCGSDEIYSEGDKVTRVSDKYQLTGDIQQGNLSLTVVNVSMEDRGPYCCRVDIQGMFNDQTTGGASCFGIWSLCM
uniref:Ig-like domain-containing protein n=1 Tax=Erpetoichthys calabaricus TaxID=27687 RepID=A0A8C4XD71_ERPCA